MKSDTFVFTNSELTAAECSNKHHILYGLQLRPRSYRKMKNLNIGHLVHVGVEVLYRQTMLNLPFEDLTSPKMLRKVLSHVRVVARKQAEKFITEPGESELLYRRNLKRDIGMVLVMVEGFFNHIFCHEKYEIVEPELQFIVPVRTKSGRRSPKFKFAGKTDGILRNILGDNRLYLHEIKCPANWGEEDEKFLSIDEQITGYCWAMREIGIQVSGVVYTVIKKPGMDFSLTKEAQKRKREATKENKTYVYNSITDYETAEELVGRMKKDMLEYPEKYFIRKMFQRKPEDLDAFSRRLYDRCRDVVVLAKNEPFPQPSLMKCRTCTVFDLCANWGEETMKGKYERKSQKHTELNYGKFITAGGQKYAG